ncbi:MAG: alpha-1,2-fucosyltransferase [Chlamydiia bacterium]|nr:alpha-1,2-fucosyltransferase [Chlamydiia bacterium]
MKIFVLVFLIVGKCLARDYVTICEEWGQFGSQLFSYAIVMSWAWTHDKIPVFSKEFLIGRPGGQLNYDRIFHRLPQNISGDIHINPDKPYHIGKYQSIGGIPCHFVPGNVCMCGVTHEFTYFDPYKDRIRELYAAPAEVLSELKGKYSRILDHPKTVAVHIRTYHPQLELHCFLGEEYYQTAMDFFDDEHLFVVFSDRIEWCKRHLNWQGENVVFIEGNDYITDFYLMTFCKNLVTSNSTFSWWAAYLKQTPDGLIIAPNRWFYDPYDADPYLNRISKNFYPNDWVILSVPSPERDWTLIEYKTSSLHEN